MGDFYTTMWKWYLGTTPNTTVVNVTLSCMDLYLNEQLVCTHNLCEQGGVSDYPNRMFCFSASGFIEEVISENSYWIMSLDSAAAPPNATGKA